MANQQAAAYQWLDCSANFNPIPGENGISFQTPNAGPYAVEITLNNCVDTSICMLLTNLSEAVSTELMNVTVYPQPSRGHFTVQTPHLHSISNWHIHDPAGRTIYRAENIQPVLTHQVSLDIPSGFYLLTIQTDHERWTYTLKIL